MPADRCCVILTLAIAMIRADAIALGSRYSPPPHLYPSLTALELRRFRTPCQKTHMANGISSAVFERACVFN